MASYEQMPNGKWRVYVEVGTTGNRKRLTKVKATKDKAEKWAATIITSNEKGTLVDPKDITLAEYFEDFLEKKKDHVATTTYDNYVKKYQAHIKPKLGDYKLQNIKSFHLEDFFSKKRKHGRINGEGGLSENTLKKLYVLMSQFFKKAVKFHIISHNPLVPVEAPVPKKTDTNYMKEQEFNKLIKVARENDYFMYVFIVFMLFTGLRKSEALALAWSIIDLKKGIITVRRRLINKAGEGSIIEEATKNEFSKRKIKISPKIVSLFKEYKKHQLETRLAIGEEYQGDDYDLVFCRPDGYRLSVNFVNKRIKKLYNKADLPYNSNIHILRHTFATMNVNNNVDPEIIQNMLGHSKITTTMDIYYHHDIEQQNEAVKKMEESIQI